MTNFRCSTARFTPFSWPRFAFTIVVTLAGLFALLWWLVPGAWGRQLQSAGWRLGAAFFMCSLAICFLEYFFHRYVLHMPAIPLLRGFYRKHTLHHALTRVVRKSGNGILCIENKFPIVEHDQHEAAFFPWYAMALFAAGLTPLLTLLQFLVPAFPWFLAGFASLALSLTLYETFHAVNHWPLERWEPLITHPRWGRLWQPVYGFHLRHHAVIDCNESISGFFGLPIADWVLGTCVLPRTVYCDGEAIVPSEFRSPRPCALVRRLDLWAQAAVQRHRARQSSDPHLFLGGQ